ncbi:hypothetical protein [uncultured Paracoccus sp.]|uniref:hypothetical protein n=1 Tax=uncultured Paracoccus sp. TaxID=189685 RepID=UPI00260FF776|nr:hypothetical protein [uncultured Paracoccus sp.]
MTTFDHPVQPAARPRRAAAIERLFAAIADCREDDLRFILSSVLEDICAGEPAPGFYGVDQEAEMWAALASYDELRGYFFACGDRLSKGGLGTRGKIRLVQRLMEDMTPAERAAVQRGLKPASGHPGRVVERGGAELRCAVGIRDKAPPSPDVDLA